MSTIQGNGWVLTPLGKLLSHVSRPVRVDPGATYRLLGAKWYAKGLFVRAEKTGAEIQAKSLFQVKAGDFIYNRLFAWKGSFAVASEEHDGCFVSNEFPCFKVDHNRLDPRFLWLYFSRQKAWSEALGLSSGSPPTSRNRLKEEQFLRMVLPLPPLSEQQRIVARIEEVAAKIKDARHLRKEVESSLRGVSLGAYREITKGARRLPIAEVAPLIRRPVDVEPSVKYHELGIRSFGKGTFHKPPIEGTSVGTKKLFRIGANDLLFNIVFAWEGAVAVATPRDHGRVGSHRFLTCVPKEGLATSKFLCFHFLTDEGLEQLGKASPGGAGRNRTLGLKTLEEIPVPVPVYEKQLWFDSLEAKMDSLKALQTQSAAELDALLPSILDKAFKGDL